MRWIRRRLVWAVSLALIAIGLLWPFVGSSEKSAGPPNDLCWGTARTTRPSREHTRNHRTSRD
jgi:hypothetical protein